MTSAHKEGDHAKFNELLTKFNDIDKQLADAHAADERAAKIKELEDRAKEPQGRVTAPPGATKPAESEIRATPEYETNFRQWIRSKGKAEARALSLFSDPDGGYLKLPARMESEIIAPVKNLSVVQGLSKYEMIDGVLSSQGINVTAITGNSQKGVRVDLTTESTTGEAFGWSKRKMRSNPFTHWCKIPNELIDFSGIDIVSWIVNEIRERKAVEDDTRFLYGEDPDEPLGLMVDSADGIPASTRDKVITASGVVTYDLLVSAFFTLKPQHRANATWLVSTNLLKQIMQLADDNGNPLPPLGLERNGAPMIMGRPVIESNNVQPTLSGENFATSQYIGMLGNFNRYHIMESKAVGLRLDPYRLSDENVTVCYVQSWLDAMPVLGEAFVRLKSNG